MTSQAPTLEELRREYDRRGECFCTGACKTGPCPVVASLAMTFRDFTEQSAHMAEKAWKNPERAAAIRAVLAGQVNG